MNLFRFLSVDPSLGKIDKHSLSQQTLMELFIENISNGNRICGSKENPKDLSEWQHTRFDPSSDEITKIYWSFWDLKGSVEFQWLPFSMKVVDLMGNELSGTADLTCLPEGLTFFNIAQNNFEGTIDLTKLPSTLVQLNLHTNAFHGHTDFRHLPESLFILNISSTQLAGEICAFDGEVFTSDSNVEILRNV